MEQAVESASESESGNKIAQKITIEMVKPNQKGEADDS